MSSAAELPGHLSPIIYGCDGTVLGDDEKAFFRDAMPAGFILFTKNCDNPEQVKALIAALRESVGWHAPVLFDQEGGRVQRLKPPHWPQFPAPRIFGDAYKKNPAQAVAALHADVTGLAAVQGALGADVNCIPVLDVVPEGTITKAIGDRAFGADAALVSALGIETCRAAIAAGMTPVMKHMPGHGRADVDSHFELPRVTTDAATLAATDWEAFRIVAKAIDNTQLWGMTCHVIYTDVDADLPATLSPTVLGEIIRGSIGFDGLLLSDDLFMKALSPYGDPAACARLALEAGNDIAAFCLGTLKDRMAAAKAIPAMRPDSRRRLADWAKNRRPTPPAKAVDTCLAEMEQALSLV